MGLAAGGLVEMTEPAPHRFGKYLRTSDRAFTLRSDECRNEPHRCGEKSRTVHILAAIRSKIIGPRKTNAVQ